MVNEGLGKIGGFDTENLDTFTPGQKQLTPFFGGLFTSEICWALGISIVKFSILAFYWRLFSHVRNARLAVYTLLLLVTSWTIGVVRLSCKT